MQILNKEKRFHQFLFYFVLTPWLLKRVYISFSNKKKQCPQIYIKLTPLEDNDSRKHSLKYSLLRWCSFWEMSKTMSCENTFLHAKYIFVSWSLRRKLFSWHCFTQFSNSTAPEQVIFSGKLSTKLQLYKFSVNLWKLCFLL